MEAMEQERHLMRMPPFSQVDATALLQCIEEILPVGTREWDMVLTNYHERHAKPRDRPLRDRRMIRNKFYNLRYLKKGRTTLTHMERWANSIQTRIIARTSRTNTPSSELDYLDAFVCLLKPGNINVIVLVQNEDVNSHTEGSDRWFKLKCAQCEDADCVTHPHVHHAEDQAIVLVYGDLQE
ncbi:hypothetical protein Poli38472_003617 [Pythium oligandrum]|uniref:Uncharacterized protein n=1 Tax=Pythium oligandrum TaxID=41045 RepID=A0A8K1FNG7_PYTOL|nr:hypothetical protein Poli38472_003617 [Pythium oligandrum]|eukprot:TMW65852.1 hypothetical protein Poli38472_003617 [Pythium oligandrum]